MNYQDLDYLVTGEGRDLVLLHGWGTNKECWSQLMADLSTEYRVWALDLPGFGNSPAPNSVVGVVEYAHCVNEFIQNNIGGRVALIGHSFGGRIAIVLANISTLVERLILIDSAGVPPRFSFKRFFKILRYKHLKKRVSQGREDSKKLDSFGSADWQNAKGVMRGVLAKVVNQNLGPASRRITQPTLLVWGSDDKITPLYMAKTLRKNIKNSTLVIVEGGHFCFLNQDILFHIYKFLENW